MVSRTLRPAASAAALCLFLLPSSGRAEDAAVLVAPGELHAGGRSAFTLTSFDAATREPLARPVVVELLQGGERVTTLYVGATGRAGRLHVPFDVPDLASGTYEIQARVTGLRQDLTVETTVSHTPAILIETDKPIYKPGQTIRGRLVCLDNALRPSRAAVELTIHDAKGLRIEKLQLEANEYGVADFSLPLAQEVNFGTWKVRARSEGVESTRDIRVEEYTLPRYELQVELPRTWALVDEPVTGAVTARYFFGKDVEGSAVLSARRWVGTWEEYARAEGALENGRFPFTLPAVGFVAGSPQAGGQGAVTLEVEVTDSTGHSQKTTEMLTITEASVVLGLVPRSRTLKPEIPLEVLVTARSPDGVPLDATVRTEAVYYGQFGEPVGTHEEVVEVTAGAGTIELVPPAGSFYAEVTASTQRDGRATSTEVRIDGSYSTSGHFLALSRLDGTGAAAAGQVVHYAAVSSHPGTVYYEVYAGGRTVFSDVTETDTFSFAVAPDMAPKARVVAYKIGPDNEVAADSLELEVSVSSLIAIGADFGQEQARPGESVQVTLDAGTGERTLIGLSVVDESVLALGRSRLHLQDVFAELERRFLEPQVEVHEGEEPGVGPPGRGRFFDGAPRAVGALDVLEEAGLVAVATDNVTISRGDSFDWWWNFAEDAAGPPRAGDPGAGEGSAPEEVRLRQFFPETWVWEPLLVTDEAGRATLTLTVPDSITGWKLSAVGTSPAGIGFGESELTVFQDFFVEPSLPYSVTRGEEFPVKVDIFNYLETSQEVSLSLAGGEWYELAGDADLTVTVGPSSATAVHFPIRPVRVGEHAVEVTALGSQLSDRVRRTIRVVPEGTPVESVFNSVIEAGQTVALDVSFPPETVPESARAFLHITPSPVSQTMQGVSDLLGMPYGCGEQNMIFLAPDIEVLKYLREIGELNPEVRAEAEYYVNVGYQRELTFQSDDGGFAAFGGAEGSLWLTAFVLSTFAGAREVRDIDEAVLAQAAGMLVSRQNPDGSFRTDDFLIHKEMDGGLENIYAMAAYVANALADYLEGVTNAEVAQALAWAGAYLRDARSPVWDDPYSLSIAAVALLKVPGFEDVAENTVDRLLELAIHEGVGIHWEPYPVETTGYATMALLASMGGAGRPEAAAAVDWLSTQRNALGGYGSSTQDTVVAIRALFVAARKVRRDLELDLELRSGGEVVWTAHIDVTNFDVLQAAEVPLGAPAELAATGDGSVGYQVVRRYNLPGEVLPPSRDMVLEVEYDTEGIEVDDILDVRVRLLYTGPKEATGMVIADIGVPTGFQVAGDSLAALVEAGTVSRAEVAGRKVISYIESLTQGTPLAFSFQMRALYPVRAVGPLSEAYEYYDGEVRASHRMDPVLVGQGPAGEADFLRGEANRDGAVDLADAVYTLSYLFRAATLERPLDCEDAADTNDDGSLNITDPVYLLRFLFMGGPPPAPPYPERGSDPTEDRLRCPLE